MFRFLNEERALIKPEDWDDPSVDKLWRYNLHYFDDLNAEGASSRTEWHKALLGRWVRENEPGHGTGWEPYPTSLRIVNWIKWVLAGNDLSHECLDSLAVQTRWLSRRLENHLLGNHLFSNAKALVFAGLFFQGAEADKWLDTGLRILRREVSEQILADGGQFELSTMYHALALEDMLDLLNMAAAFPQGLDERHQFQVDAWMGIVAKMRHWITAMCHQDGEMGLFNDAAMGIAPSIRELEAYAERLNFSRRSEISDGVINLKSSGYLRVQHGPLVSLIDVANVGPDYLPAHGHADTLTFELSLFGQRLIVNSGTSHYGTDERRMYERGTAAHNTITIDGQNSSEVWGNFRVARRAFPILSSVNQQERQLIIEASHDGYRRLSGKNIHRRKWTFNSDSMMIEDEVAGAFKTAEAYFHLHPDIRIEEQPSSDNGVILLLRDGERVEFAVDGGAISMESGFWHPGFGENIPNSRLIVKFLSPRLKTCLRWRGK